MRSLIIVTIATVGLGCTKGAVVDATHPARGVPDARIVASPVSGRPFETYEARTSDGLVWGTDNFAFGPHPGAESYSGPQLEPYRWYRFEVTRDGFEPGVFYRFHPGYAEPCEHFECPDGANCCHREDFSLWPVGAPHAALPDLIVDHQTLANETYFQCVNLDDDPMPEVIAIRSTVTVANVGDGDLVVVTPIAGGSCGAGRPCSSGYVCSAGTCAAQPCIGGNDSCPDGLTCARGTCGRKVCDAAEECESGRCGEDGRCEPSVMQQVAGVSGAAGSSRVVEARVSANRYSGSWELDHMVGLGLVRRSASCEDDFQSGCVVAQSTDGARCIAGHSVFDSALIGREAAPTADACRATTQVLRRGESVSFGHDSARQLVLLGEPDEALGLLANGPFDLVASVDPLDVVAERMVPTGQKRVEERGNNVARVAVDIPRFDYSPTGFNDDLCRASVALARCEDCAPVLDCSMCEAGLRDGVLHRCAFAPNLTRRQEEMCGDYPPRQFGAGAFASRK